MPYGLARSAWRLAGEAEVAAYPGHEGVGVVTEVGPGVTSLKVGDRVGVPWLFKACGECEYCLSGQETLCPNQLNGGYTADGAYAEYCVAPADYVARIPDGVDPVEIAPILCAGVTTYKALKVSGAKPGEWVAIYGIGGLGHIALQYAKAMGLKVIAVDIQDDKLELADELGADMTVNNKKVDPVKEIKDKVGGVQAAISVAVNKVAFEQAYHSVKRGGSVVFGRTSYRRHPGSDLRHGIERRLHQRLHRGHPKRHAGSVAVCRRRKSETDHIDSEA